MLTRYQKRISGPLLDLLRVDTLGDIAVPRVDYHKLTDDRLGEPSEAVPAPVYVAVFAVAPQNDWPSPRKL